MPEGSVPAPDPSPARWRAAVAALTRSPEPALLPHLITQARMGPDAAARTQALAMHLARPLRAHTAAEGGRAGLVQGLLQEFALSSQEGVALMCLAEALLRIPDDATRDALIRDKIGRGDWQSHLGHSGSLFVHAATWGLVLTGRLVATHSETGLGAALRRVVSRGGEPLVRKGVDMAMRLMGEQFVCGETIEAALHAAARRESQGFRHSYDMLGEAALTDADAQRYLAAYAQAIEAIAGSAAGRGPIEGPGISVKLSALHPRYSRAQRPRVHDELYPRLLGLAQQAAAGDIGFNIDAEESERLELSLDLLERLCAEPSLQGWAGLGFVIQAYQKRCPAVVDVLVDLARRSGRRLMVRLVEGAYWDSEIKRAQVEGQAGYPVYTRKAYTDVAYLACARKLLAAPEAVYPQFATHNAQTMAAVHEMADPRAYVPGQYEFQCLHGMGEGLYEHVVAPRELGGLGRPCRIYAPVGTHDTLLAYLVRRLLENGANTSFVNRVATEAVALETLVEDPVATVEALAEREGLAGRPHPRVPLPRELYRDEARLNSMGLDLHDEAQLARLSAALASPQTWRAGPMLDDGQRAPSTDVRPVHNPARPDEIVGWVQDSTTDDVARALDAAARACGSWAQIGVGERTRMLAAAADRLEADTEALVPLLVREAGKTRANAVSEVREAVDFLRFYARQAERDLEPHTHRPLGPVVSISPWNFPLAIFTGQVAAALAAGNPVLAKPAEQTPLVAAQAVQALHAAGVPRDVLQLLPGPGETIGAALVADVRVQAVLFTGSTEVSRLIQATLARRLDARGRPVTFVAETGGQNAMIVDSSALPEQVVVDVLASAFDSAGQRCSALRVLCVQREAADRLLQMLEGALAEWRVGDPAQLDTDVGPVIDAQARRSIEAHVEAFAARGRRVRRPARVDPALAGHFVRPALLEIDDLRELKREVFGPVLHVMRYERGELDALVHQINAAGYGLTAGVHTRIDETVARVLAQIRAGNVYVNRSVVGAVVGVQPFGGEGLSGTGPKAGGPLALLRLLAERPVDAAARAIEHLGLAVEPRAVPGLPEEAGAGLSAPVPPSSPSRRWRQLRGPTGEMNLYATRGREAVLCLADSDDDRLCQLAAVRAVDGRAVWPASARAQWLRLPQSAQDRVTLVQDWRHAGVAIDVVLLHGDAPALKAVCQALAERPGPIVPVIGLAPGETAIPLDALIIERSVSINTAAAGGNASLMTLE